MKVLPRIGDDKKFIFTGLAIFSLVVLFLNHRFGQNVFIGILFSIFYFLFSFSWVGKIFGKVLNLESEFQFLFGLFLTLYLMAFGLAVPIVFFKITPLYFYLFLLIFTLIISFVNHRFQTHCQSTAGVSTRRIANNEDEIKIPKVFYILFSIFYIFAWFLLIKARTGKYLLSPWVVIPKYYQVFWFILAFLLILFIFSKTSSKKILFFLILTSLLFHAYLPIVSENSFGVDRWRQVGAERRLINGQIEPPALIGKVSYVKIGPISLPRIFFTPNKFSYSNQWGMTIGLSWLTQIDILKIDQYLIWFLWSIFFTIFVYKLSQLIFKQEKLSLLITFVSLFCFFSLQVGGSITVPHAIGILPFLFFLILFFLYLRGEKKFLPLIAASFVLLIFNYILYLLLAIEIFILGLILKNEIKIKKIILPILIILFIFSLPLLDRLSGTTFFTYQFNEAIKVFPEKIGEFMIKVFPSYLYYRGGENLALPNLIKNFPWTLIFTPLVFLFVILGLVFYLKPLRLNPNNKGEVTVKILAIFLLIFLANQFISFSFMKDYRLLCKRLSNVLLLFLTFFFTAGLYWLIKIICVKYRDRDKQHRVRTVAVSVLALFLASLSLTTYASGPAYGNVTNDELMVAKYLDQEIKSLEVGLQDICVFDAGWRLLALEAVNGMIAGNFPTDPIDFVQKEKDKLYRQMLKNPSKEILDKTLEITGAKKCFFVVNQGKLKSDILDKIKEILDEPKIISDVYIWQYH